MTTSEPKTAALTNKKIRPFLRWAGGKQNLVRSIAAFLPSLDTVYQYHEPFLGAASLFFATSFKKNFLSDINAHLINAYVAVRDNPQLLFNRLTKLQKHLTSDNYYKLRDEFNTRRQNFDLAQAARFIFLVHTSFNGIYRVNRMGHYNVPVGKLKPNLPSKDHLLAASKKLATAELYCRNYLEVLNSSAAGDLVYLDPPYPPLNGTSSFRHYTSDKFSPEDQEAVAELAKELSKKGCYVLISNADLPSIRKLYKSWRLNQLEAVRFVSCKSKRHTVHELIIRNY